MPSDWSSGDDYPGSAGPERDGFDQWGYAWRNCTSWSMHCIVDRIGLGPFYWGNGGDFGRRAAAAGFAVNGVPQPHDIFSIPAGVLGVGPYGHTGAVLSVEETAGGGNIFLAADYNWLPLRYDEHWLPASGISFIHFTPPAPEDDMALSWSVNWDVRVSGKGQHDFRIVNGALIQNVDINAYTGRIVGANNELAGVQLVSITPGFIQADGSCRFLVSSAVASYVVYQGPNPGSVWNVQGVPNP